MPVLSAYRLRRRIARDPALQQEWAALTQVADNLRQLPTPAPYNAAPRWPERRMPDVSRVSLRRRTVRLGFAAAGAFATVAAGTVAVQYHLGSSNGQAIDRGGRQWNIRSHFKGRVTVYDLQGNVVGEMTRQRNGTGEVWITVAEQWTNGKPAEVAAIAPDEGVHPLTVAKSGDIIGFVELKRSEGSIGGTSLDPLLLHAAGIFAPGDVLSDALVCQIPGLKAYVDRTTGIAWKLRGYADVAYGDNAVRERSWPLANVPMQTVMPVDARDAKRRFWQRYRDNAPPANAPPVITYSIAGPRGTVPGHGYLMYRGNWVQQWRQGTFRGYGRHTVRDEHGRPLVTFTLKQPAVRPLVAGPPVKR